MTDVERISTAGSPASDRDDAACGRSGRRAGLGVLLTSAVALVTTITAPVVIAPRPAGADEVSDLQARAAQIAQQMLQEQLRIGGLQQEYAAATAHLQAVNGEIADTQRAVAADQRRIARDEVRLRSASLSAYVESGSTTANSASSVFSTDERTSAAVGEYQSLVADDTTVALDLLHTDQARLRHQQQILDQQQSEADAAQQQASSLLGQSEAEQSALGNEQSQVKGQLAVAIAQQQAAREAAAEAAIRAAQQQAAQQAAAAQRAQVQAPAPAATPTTQSPTTTAPSAGPGPISTPTTSAPVPPAVAPAPTTTTTSAPPVSAPPAPVSTGGGSGPALNSFLQCVVQHESGGDYGIVSPDGQYFGAFQFSQSTWNEAAQLAGMPQLVGVPPNTATPAEQNALAVALYSADGQSPWYDPCS